MQVTMTRKENKNAERIPTFLLVTLVLATIGAWYWALTFDASDPTIVSTCVMFLAVSLTYMIIGIILIFIGESKKDAIDESSQN